jgi:hypothetical protein
MSSTPTVRLDSVAYSHSIANETRRLVGGFHQVMHLGDFHCEVDQTKLVAMPVVDMTSVEEARLALEPYLRGWELRSELFENRPIKFKRAGHVVRDEVGGQVVGVEVTVEVEIASQATGVVTTRRLHLPEGPPLTITEEVRRVADRWRDVTTGKERLLVGAYWVLTELERYYWGRSEIGKRLAVSVKALNRLGELANRNGPERPLSQEETTWIREFMPRLILQVAEVDLA